MEKHGHTPPADTREPTQPPPKPEDSKRSAEPPWMGLAERGVQALEALAKEPVVEIEAGPPVCPACGLMNPEITVRETDGKGPMHEFFLATSCTNCGNKFYAVPMNWRTFMRREEVEAEMQGRRVNVNGHS